jgi:hypothetical protein
MVWKLSRLFRRRVGVTPLPRLNCRLQIEELEPRTLLSAGIGTGLTGDYYSDPNAHNLASTRIDGTVNFTWSGSPAPSVPSSNYSVRWTGQVQALTSETYTFFTDSTGLTSLWVNGQKLVNDTTSHALTEDKGTIALTAGQTYTLTLQTTAAVTGATTEKLLWRTPTIAKQVIPSTQLYTGGGWLDTDIGSPALRGSVGSTGGTYTVQGGGLSTATADQEHLVYQGLNGDGTIIAQVTSVQNTGAMAAAGITLRQSDDPASPYAALVLQPSGTAVLQYRTAEGASTLQVGSAGVGTSSWLKMIRNGNLIDAYVSPSGAGGTWTLVGTASVPMNPAILAGMMVTAGNTTALNASTFNNVKIAPAVPLGGNIGAVMDWSLNNVFVDIFKQARRFTSLSTGQPARTDSNGWPTEDFQAIIQSGSRNTAKVYNGTYKLSFTGRANVSTACTPGGSVSNLVYNASTNTTTADVTVNASNSDHNWYFILDFSNTNGGVKNITLIRPGYAANTTQIFTNQFLSELAPFSVLRTMDFTRTNGNTQINWGDRAKVTDATQSTARGVAWEYVIDLANVTGKDIWINIPQGATDNYVQQLATLIKSNLNPDRVVYVEYSNEVWNRKFSQSHANLDAAVAQVEAGMASGTPSTLCYPGETAKNPDGTWASQWTWSYRRTAQRLVQISNDFAAVYGQSAINNQIRPVLASQMDNPSILRTGLEYIQKVYGAPNQYIYAVAGAPYFSLGKVDPRTYLTTTQVLNRLRASMNRETARYAAYNDLGTYYGLRTMAYEGGPSTFGPHNITAKKNASLSATMKSIVTQYLDNWFSQGGGLFNWYTAGTTYYDTRFGTWGLTNDITNLNTPKYQGVNAVAAAPPVAVRGGYAVPGVISANNYVGNPRTTDPDPPWVQDGTYLDYLVNAPASGTYNLAINYAATDPGETLQLLVNNHAIQTLTLPVTGPGVDSRSAPNQFANTQPMAVWLNQGLNVVRLNIVLGGYTLNKLKFTAPSSA